MFTSKTMEAVRQHSPVILLLGPCENDRVDRWLELSPYSTHEAANPIQVLEHISDYTLRDRTDVIFVHVDSIADDLAFMQNIVATDDSEVPIIAFDSNEKSGDSIDALAARLVQLIPHHTVM